MTTLKQRVLIHMEKSKAAAELTEAEVEKSFRQIEKMALTAATRGESGMYYLLDMHVERAYGKPAVFFGPVPALERKLRENGLEVTYLPVIMCRCECQRWGCEGRLPGIQHFGYHVRWGSLDS